MIDLLEGLESENNHNHSSFTADNVSYQTPTNNVNDAPSIASMDVIEDIFSQIDMSIKEIEQRAHIVNQLCDVKRRGLPAQQKSAIKEVESFTRTTTVLIQNVKKMLQKCDDILHDNMKQTQKIWIQNMYNAMVNKFQKSILNFQQSTKNFKDIMAQDFIRQVKIVKPNISDQGIKIMMDSSDPALFIQQQMMATDSQMLDEINELEDEHAKLQKLDKTMIELQEMFNSCAALVSNFQEQLDIIEDNVGKTKIHVKKAKKELQQAEVYVKKARKTRVKSSICCLLFLILIALILLGPIFHLIPLYAHGNSSAALSHTEPNNANYMGKTEPH